MIPSCFFMETGRKRNFPAELVEAANFTPVFQEGMEFSPPRIHSPYYHIDDTCNPYAKDEKLFLETFQKHFKQPAAPRSSSVQRVSSSLLMALGCLLSVILPRV